ncbi:MAG: trimethylamine methyltransferase family protein [Anaerovoracaceae bacterium]
MKLSTKLLSESEILEVNNKAFELLEETGVHIKSEKALEALEVFGAKVDWDKMIAKLPEELVLAALDTAPKEFVLGARNPKYDYKVPSYSNGHLLSGISTNVYDPYTREKRPSLKQDIINAGRVFQTVDTGVAAWTAMTAMDMPDETHCLHEMAAILQGTSKHIQFELRKKEEAKYAIAILKEVLGSDKAIKERKIASVLYCPISPLSHDKDMLDAYLELAEYAIPVNIFPMPMVGLTSPASTFATLCQITAETLSGLVIFQSVKPGWPIIFGAACGVVDPRNGKYVKAGEQTIVCLGGLEMARYYGLPSAVSGAGTFETLPLYMAGADLIDGIGACDNAMAISFERIITEDEIGKRCLRLCKGMEINEKTDLVSEIKKAGPGGSFLGNKSTVKNFRNKDEFYFNEIFPPYLRVRDEEGIETMKIANKKVIEILEGEFIDKVPEETILNIEKICKKADIELSK